MAEMPSVLKYGPQSNRDPPPAMEDPPAQAVVVGSPTPTPVVTTGVTARNALRGVLQQAWNTEPSLVNERAALAGYGEQVVGPVYRAVNERTRYGTELRAAARESGVSALYKAVWGTQTRPPRRR
jgi:hypothetical protein